MGRRGNGAWTVFVIERKLLLVLRKKYNELKKLTRSRLQENCLQDSDCPPAMMFSLLTSGSARSAYSVDA
jgi:hypothetical protein